MKGFRVQYQYNTDITYFSNSEMAAGTLIYHSVDKDKNNIAIPANKATIFDKVVGINLTHVVDIDLRYQPVDYTKSTMTGGKITIREDRL